MWNVATISTVDFRKLGIVAHVLAFPTVYRADNAGATLTLPSKTSAIGAPTTTDVVRDEHFQRRSAFDSSEYGFSLTTPVDLMLNGRAIGSTGELPESGVMHHDGIRTTALTERNIRFDAALLKSGANVLELTKRARARTDGALYDYRSQRLSAQCLPTSARPRATSRFETDSPATLRG